GFPVDPDWDEIPGADDGHAERQRFPAPRPRAGAAHGKVDRAALDPAHAPVTVARFCRPHMCSMSVNRYASTKLRYREINAERRTMTTLQMVRREASCACCRGFLDGKFNRRHFVRAVAIGAATLGLVPHFALAAEGNYEAMILSCIDPRMQEPVH